MQEFRVEERRQLPTAPADPLRKAPGDGDGPKAPDVKRPDTRRLLERMRRVDPEQARRYRQRSGE